MMRVAKGYACAIAWRLRGVQVEDRVVVEGYTPSVTPYGTVCLGSRLSFRSLYARSRFGAAHGATLTIGARGFVNSGTSIYANRSIRIGDNCLIGENVRIDDSDYHQVDEGAATRTAAVVIENNVWIANDCTILPGVTIGKHSVVGAGSVVTKSFPDRSLIAGNPARLIRAVTASDGFVRR